MTAFWQAISRRQKRGWREVARSVFVVVLALSFALQAQISSSHIHVGLALADQAQSAGVGGDSKKSPNGQNHVPCPLCQQLASAHAYLSSGSLLLVRVDSTFALQFSAKHEVVDCQTIAFNWRSRAPPLA